MLISPIPGVNRQHLRDTLESVGNVVGNLRTSGPREAQERLLAYLDWANEAVAQLARLIAGADLDRLVLTQRHATLLAGVSHFRYPEETKLVYGLVNLELDQRVTAFEQALQALRAQIDTWTRPGDFVVADSSFYIQHPDKLEAADFGKLCSAREDPVHLLLPIVIVDELDNLKQNKDKHTRWRAGSTLAVVDRIFGEHPNQPATLRARDNSPADSGYTVRGEVTMELLFDPPGHVRLPIADDEIIDRALAVQALAARDVLLLTYDTGQSTRARAAGLKVNKLRGDAGTGDEPAR